MNKHSQAIIALFVVIVVSIFTTACGPMPAPNTTETNACPAPEVAGGVIGQIFARPEFADYNAQNVNPECLNKLGGGIMVQVGVKPAGDAFLSNIKVSVVMGRMDLLVAYQKSSYDTNRQNSPITTQNFFIKKGDTAKTLIGGFEKLTYERVLKNAKRKPCTSACEIAVGVLLSSDSKYGEQVDVMRVIRYTFLTTTNRKQQ